MLPSPRCLSLLLSSLLVSVASASATPGEKLERFLNKSLGHPHISWSHRVSHAGCFDNFHPSVYRLIEAARFFVKIIFKSPTLAFVLISTHFDNFRASVAEYKNVSTLLLDCSVYATNNERMRAIPIRFLTWRRFISPLAGV